MSDIVGVYNKYLIDFLLERKSHVKSILKSTGHTAIDPTSEEYIKHASKFINDASESLANNLGDLSDDRVQKFELLPGIAVKDIVDVETISEDDPSYPYIYTLAVLAATYVDGTDALSNNVLNALSAVQKGNKMSVDDPVLKGIMDSDILNMIQYLSDKLSVDEGGSVDGFMKNIDSDSKIASIASEITQEIESEFKTDGEDMPEMSDLLNFDKMGDKNSPLGNIVSKVGMKFKEKMDNGELKQEELVQEALSFLGKMGSGSSKGGGGMGDMGAMMNQVMNMASSMNLSRDPVHGSLSKENTKERLRKKLSEKNKTME